MRQHIATTALAAAVTALAYGQNLNPTVEVTNAYEGGASSIVKPLQQMAVPDSVTTFNLDFDYSVFDNPYRGAYEFKPYYVQLKPAPKLPTENKFYLKLGAGYTLHPELDLVWTPVRKEKFQLDVYATHHSYFGRYHQFGREAQEDNIHVFKPTGDKMKGFLTDSRIGVDGRYGWDGGEAMLDVSYRHRMADDAFHFQKMGGIVADGRVRSLPSDAPHFLYDAKFNYHYLDNDLSDAVFTDGRDFAESRFLFDGTFGPVFDGGRRIVADVNLGIARYMGNLSGYTGSLSVVPKYEFALDRWHFSLGAKLSTLIYSDNYSASFFRNKSGVIFPEVHIDYHLLDDRLVLQTSATGGDRFNTLSDAFYAHPFSTLNAYGHSLERIRAMIGARGNIASRFRYDLQAGYARWSRAPMEGYIDSRDQVSSYYDPAAVLFYVPAVGESGPFNLLFAELEYGWKSQSVTVDGKMAYRYTNITSDGSLSSGIFAPAAFTGFIRPAWHWGDRFTAGADVAWSTSRSAQSEKYEMRIPGWVDLGLFAEYRFTSQLGFWAKGGNLLNQVVQRNPLHAEAGMYFTAGVLLSF